MYTYHYFKNRSIAGCSKTSDYLFHTVLICGMAYVAVTLLVMFT